MTTAPAAMAPEIRLDNLEKRFGDVHAVDKVSLDVAAGEFFSLLGPSGCGKTTTLRMIGGFELPTGGRILLRGRDVTNEPPDKRPVNMVFQHYALFPHLTSATTSRSGASARAWPGDEVRRRVGRRARARPPRRATSGASRTSSPAASSSGSRWPARS